MDGAAAVEWVTVVVYVGLAAVTLALRTRQTGSASSWLALTFGALGAAAVLGLVPADDLDPVAQTAVSTAATALGLAFPYLLFRFAGTFRPPSRRAVQVATWGWVLLTVVRPLTPAEAELGSVVSLLYTIAALGYWTWLSSWVVLRLWQRSGEQAAVARRRLRGMASAAAVLNVAILALGLGGGSPALFLASQVLALVSALLFVVGFAPPRTVRWLWRRGDEQRLRAEEQRLGGATDAAQVAGIVVPAAARLFGGRVALFDGTGRPLADHEGQHADLSPLPSVRVGEVRVDGVLLALGLQHGQLVVEANPYTPFFGKEEVDLLRTVGVALDLALGRVRLSELERSARLEAERTNSELEALLYGISHDLRTPLVALTGYVDILTEEEQAADDRAYVLERVRANTAYMDALIRDLLELSRIGRIDERTEPVDLRSVARELAADVERANPLARVVVGDLAVVTMSSLRARQLLSNLIHNAVRHAGRPDVTVTVGRVLDHGEAAISVRDDGAGIPAEYRDRVFGIFERLQGHDERDGSTGVGLAMCRKIVEGAGGRIWVADSDDGADLRFVLPGVPTGVPLQLETHR